MKIINNIFRNEKRSYKSQSINYLFSIEKEMIKIYTDGSYKFKDNNILGYAFAIENNNKFFTKNGYINVNKSRKNLGALYAETVAIEKAIEFAYKKDYNNFCVLTDSKYIVSALYGKFDFINPVLHTFINRLKNFLDINYNLKMNIAYIEGHAGHLGNEIVNFYAKKGRKKILISKTLTRKDVLTII